MNRDARDERGHDDKWQRRQEGERLFENRIDIPGAGASRGADESKSERPIIR
jgi:hypothetical protein